MHLASLLCWLQSRGTSTETYSVLHRTGTSSCIRSPAMDTCTKPKADMQTMDLESGASSSQVKLTTPQRHTSSKLVLGLAITALILSLVGVGLGIAANVRASNNRSSLRDISRDDGVILVNSIRKADSEYKNAGALFAGTGYWARMRDMLFQRSDLRAIPSGTTIYLLGGQSNGTNGTSVILKATSAYDTYTGALSAVADMPEPRYRHAAAQLNGKVYVIGGMSARDGAGGVGLDTVMVYDIASNSWSALPAKLNQARSDCCAAAVNGRVYVAGGFAPEYTDVLASVEEFDPATGRWSLITNMTSPRGDCEAVALGDDLIVLGGVDPTFNFTAVVEAYSSRTKAWRALAAMGRPRGDFAAEALPGGRLIVLGGESTNGVHTEIATNYVEEYVAVDDVWVAKAALPEARFRHDAAHVGDKVYVFGGHPTCNSTASATSGALCSEVALRSVWGYFDMQYPNIYALSRNAPAAA